MYSGIGLGVVVTPFVPWELSNLAVWIAVHLAAVAPTALQPWLQSKPFKIAARFCLGLASASYFLSGWRIDQGWMPVWLFLLLMTGVFAICFKALFVARTRFTADPCANCPLGDYPTCDWNLPRLLNENRTDELLHLALANRESGNRLQGASSGYPAVVDKD